MNEHLEQLRQLVESGEFHHATYRCQGTLWEGLWFYRRDPSAPRGFAVSGCINSRMDADALDAAFALVRGTGISVGSYGNG